MWIPDKENGILRLLAIGDVVGRPGRKLLKAFLPELRCRWNLDLVIANVENAAGGFGLTREVYEEILKLGVDAMSSGNHVYDKPGTDPWIDEADCLVRPLNFPPEAPGKAWLQGCTENGISFALFNPIGRTFMKPYDCPFRAMDRAIEQVRRESRLIFVDIHAEATSEKTALGWYLAGRVSAVWGTHTHVPTADAMILDGFTGYLTDLGMTGAYDSVIGMKKDAVIKGFLDLRRTRFEVACSDPRLAGCVFDFDGLAGHCTGVYPLFLTLAQLEEIKNGD